MNIKAVHKAQQDFFLANKSKNIQFRKEQLVKLLNLLKTNEEALYEAIYKDFGKSKFETYETELGLIYAEIKTALKHIDRWTRKKRIKTNLANIPGRSYAIPEPLGNALIIGAWNYPYQLTLAPLIPAIAAGNTAIIKPSELAVNTSAIMQKLLNENFETGYIHVIEGGIEETSELLSLKFDKIFFTGSTRVGKIVMQAAAKHLTPVTLELGGKSPTFIFKDADLKRAAQRLAWAKFVNGGQTCVAPDYVLIEDLVKDEFIQYFREEVIKQYGYNGESKGKENYVKIINKTHHKRLTSLIVPEKIAFGGDTNLETLHISPTIMTDISWDDKIMEDEIFGPVLPVISFSDLDQVVKEVKARPKPLAMYIYTKNNQLKKKLLNEISFGGGCINDSIMHWSNPSIPIGGVGESGMGKYHDKAGFDAFTHYKGILQKRNWFEAPVKYPPFSNIKFKALKWFME